MITLVCRKIRCFYFSTYHYLSLEMETCISAATMKFLLFETSFIKSSDESIYDHKINTSLFPSYNMHLSGNINFSNRYMSANDISFYCFVSTLVNTEVMTVYPYVKYLGP